MLVDNIEVSGYIGTPPAPATPTATASSTSRLNAVLGDFGMASSDPILPGDTNADGVVNFQDLNIVLGNFGNDCP